MSEQAKSDAKAEKPSTYYEEPHEVVIDPSLSKTEKVKALATMEQDARQLAEASSEGMSGGKRDTLHEVLIAAETLALTPVTNAGVSAAHGDPHGEQSKRRQGCRAASSARKTMQSLTGVSTVGTASGEA
jgi:hypothetical protein